jgi:hypothetical protein
MLLVLLQNEIKLWFKMPHLKIVWLTLDKDIMRRREI